MWRQKCLTPPVMPRPLCVGCGVNFKHPNYESFCEDCYSTRQNELGIRGLPISVPAKNLFMKPASWKRAEFERDHKSIK